MSHSRISSLILLSNDKPLRTDTHRYSAETNTCSKPASIPRYRQPDSPVRISRLAFDLFGEKATPILNTHPEVCWASLPKPIVCPPLFMAPDCLLTSHSHSLHLYCSAASLTWDNEKTQECHYTHLRLLIGLEHMNCVGLFEALYLFMF